MNPLWLLAIVPAFMLVGYLICHIEEILFWEPEFFSTLKTETVEALREQVWKLKMKWFITKHKTFLKIEIVVLKSLLKLLPKLKIK